MTHPTIAGRALVVLLIAAAACARDDGAANPLALSVPLAAPDILATAVLRNPDNALSVVVTAHVRRADSVAVRYGTSPMLDSLTPAVTMLGDSAIVPVLGLLPSTLYTFRVIAYGGGQIVAGPPLDLTTDTLPPDLPSFVASGADPSPGFVVFAAGKYGLVIDNRCCAP